MRRIALLSAALMSARTSGLFAARAGVEPGSCAQRATAFVPSQPAAADRDETGTVPVDTTTPTASEFADALERLARFYREHPDTPLPHDVSGDGNRVQLRSYSRVADEDIAVVLTQEPTRLEQSPTRNAAVFVWDFGAGITFGRYVDAELVGEQYQATAWRLRTVEDLVCAQLERAAS